MPTEDTTLAKRNTTPDILIPTPLIIFTPTQAPGLRHEIVFKFPYMVILFALSSWKHGRFEGTMRLLMM